MEEDKTDYKALYEGERVKRIQYEKRFLSLAALLAEGASVFILNNVVSKTIIRCDGWDFTGVGINEAMDKLVNTPRCQYYL